MEILIVGGTNFIGPHVVDEVLRRGHVPVLFNRGKTDPEKFEQLEQLRGDRNEGDYASLEGRSFDAVIDLSAYFPRAVRELREAVGSDAHYVFVSTISVYGDFETVGLDEESTVAELDDPSDEEVRSERYGALKAACEEEARRFGSHTIVRPGLVVGPGDSTDRFTYWVARIARGGAVVAPPASDPIQYIDARDLARFLVDAVEKRFEGTYNAVTPPGFATVGELLDAAREATGADVEFHHADGETLRSLGLRPWVDLPAWARPDGKTAGLAAISAARALEAGLSVRSLEETVRDTWAWWRSLDEERRGSLRAGVSAEREAAALSALSARAGVGAAWDEKYGGGSYRFGTAPNAFLASVADRLPREAAVLCVGDGEGRNGVWLAEQGHRVTSIEPSKVALGKLKALAGERGVVVEAIEAALPLEGLEEDAWDAAVLIFVHMKPELRRAVHGQVRRLVKPGGLMILEAYTPEQLTSGARGGPPTADLMVRKEDLADDFDGFSFELLEETVAEINEGESHQGRSHVVHMLARRATSA